MTHIPGQKIIPDAVSRCHRLLFCPMSVDENLFRRCLRLSPEYQCPTVSRANEHAVVSRRILNGRGQVERIGKQHTIVQLIHVGGQLTLLYVDAQFDIQRRPVKRRLCRPAAR